MNLFAYAKRKSQKINFFGVSGMWKVVQLNGIIKKKLKRRVTFWYKWFKKRMSKSKSEHKNIHCHENLIMLMM